MQAQVSIEIEGVKPLLFHTFPIDTLSGSKSKSGSTGNNAEEWKATVLMTPTRELYVYNSYIVGCITAGGKQIKVGKGTLNKKVGSTLEIKEPELLLGLYVPEEEDLLRKSDEPVYLDVRSVVNPMTKGRNIRYRIAAKAGWKIKATLSWDDRTVSKEDMKACVENGGLFEGIGDGRRIGFGRFRLLSFKSI
jgi:hypothetical protein